MRWLVWLSFLAVTSSVGISKADPASVPFRVDGGTFVIPVRINDQITLDFTLDSGASEVTIPVDVFLTLQRTHTISERDLLPSRTYTLADGSTSQQRRFRIRSLRVGELELHDVVGTVSPVSGALLLGQSFLSRVHTWSVDNQKHLLVFTDDVATARPADARAAVPALSESRATDSPPVDTLSSESCGAAQNICGNGWSSLCDIYRSDFRRAKLECPGIYERKRVPIARMQEEPQSTAWPISDDACRVARKFCEDSPGSWLCRSYRKDFQQAGRRCHGVTED